MSDTPTKNTERRTKIMTIAGGIIIGMVFMCGIYFARLTYSQKTFVTKEDVAPPQSQLKFDTMQNGKYTFIVKARNEIQVKEQNEIFDEKIKSINDRTGDLYLSLTIIVTLLLFFNIGVFINASHDAKIKVEEYLFNHIGEYETKAKKMHDKLQNEYDETMTMIQSLATEYTSVIEIKKQPSSDQANPINDANNGV